MSDGRSPFPEGPLRPIGPPRVRIDLGAGSEVYKRLQKIEDVVQALALKDGLAIDVRAQEASYYERAYSACLPDTYTSRPSPDLLDNLDDWYLELARQAPDIAKNIIRSKYETLLEVTCNVQPVGNWMYVLADLALPVDTPDLLVKRIPDLVSFHPQTSVFTVPPEDAEVLASTLRDITARLRTKYEGYDARIPTRPIRKAIKWAWENFEKLVIIAEAVVEVVQAAREARRRADEERAAQDRINREILQSRPLAGAQDHVDRFDSNRDFIGSLA